MNINKLGTLLIAPPSEKSNLWQSSTVLITDCSKQGTTGLLLNKSSQMSIAEFGNRLGFDLDHVSGKLFIGGPDCQTSFSVLHSNEWRSNNTFQVNEHFSISSDDEILKRFEKGEEPKEWRMFLGMCTWKSTQLENEINGLGSSKSNVSWCTSTCDLELVFQTDIDDIWEAAVERCSLEFAQNFMS